MIFQGVHPCLISSLLKQGLKIRLIINVCWINEQIKETVVGDVAGISTSDQEKLSVSFAMGINSHLQDVSLAA